MEHEFFHAPLYKFQAVIVAAESMLLTGHMKKGNKMVTVRTASGSILFKNLPTEE